MNEQQTTSEVLQQFSQFCSDLRAPQVAALPGFDGGNIAEIIGHKAQQVAEGFLQEDAFGLLMQLAKLTLGFRIAVEGGTLSEDAAAYKIAISVAEVEKHLD